MKNSEIEVLIFDEAYRDIEAESRGISSTPGEMQRSFPGAYRAARELVSIMAESLPALALAKRQAEKISEMLHSDDEGLSSIQEVLNMQPVNALTLAHLIRLERNRTGKKAADARHDEPGGAREKKVEFVRCGPRGNTNPAIYAPNRNARGWIGISLLPAKRYGILPIQHSRYLHWLAATRTGNSA